MLTWALRLYRAPTAIAEPIAKRTFAVSILYLFVVFAALLIERAFGFTQIGLPFGHVLT